MLTKESRAQQGNKPVAYRDTDVIHWLEEQTGADWSFLLGKLPDVVFRHRWNDIAEKHGLPYASKTLANLDSQGLGPKRFM